MAKDPPTTTESSTSSTTASAPPPPPGYTPGPFKATRTTTFKIDAINIAIVHDEESTHVPPPEPPALIMGGSPCAGCGGHKDATMDPFATLFSVLAPKLMDILSKLGQRVDDLDDDDEPGPTSSGDAH